MFLDPLVHGVWPPELLALLEQHQVTWETSEEDLAVIREHTVDELGINLYYPHRVKAPSRAWHPHTRSIRPGIMSRLSCPAGG
ncbi:hypothetical protein KPZU09_65610 [Klebsiella pneumoniae]|uniref:6-phospho-beta-glucosidase n=1 Tax=Klebsiella pneumoniae TaxID=573 RepID=A0A919HZ43_KLEPN|nr:hypothetical protein KPZU09_65610 [Klebsiella pneumoniae]